MTEYLHRPSGTEVRSIGGHYSILEEGRLDVDGRTLLYIVGVAAVDRSCCGTVGCRFVHVPGYITAWRHRREPDGTSVSTVEPVSGPKDRRAIKALLERRFPHSQISFADD